MIIIFYMLIFIYHIIISLKILKYMNKIENRFIFKIMPFFATTLNYILEIIIFTIFLVLEFTNSTNTYFKTFLETVYYGTVAPATIFISSMFWILYFISEDTINISKEFKTTRILTPFLNHCVHTFIIIPVLLREIILKYTQMYEYTHPQYTYIYSMTLLTNISYIIIVHLNTFINKVWLYGILKNREYRIHIIYVFTIIWWSISISFNSL